MSLKLQPGDAFPSLVVKNLDGDDVTLGQPADGAEWQMVVVYRGKHCPLCTRFLNELPHFKQRLRDVKVDLVAVSADSKAQLEEHMENLEINFPVYFGLTQPQMETLGTYISVPRSEKETDHNFSEPALFVVNGHGQTHVVDISNNPFSRPSLETLVSGLEWIKNPDNHYPIRGAYRY